MTSTTDLLIVCGLGRSGTSLIRSLLGSSRFIEICNELPHVSEFPAFYDVLQQYRKWGDRMMANPHEAWRGVTPAYIEEGVSYLFRCFCRSFRPAIEPEPRHAAGLVDGRPRLLCVKRPEAEIQAEAYEVIFQHRKPRYIYCIRNPVSVYESWLSIAWGATLQPEDFLQRLRLSVGKIIEVDGMEPSGRVFVINVQAISSDPALIRTRVKDLFCFIGVQPDAEVDRFCREWPPVNRSCQVYGSQEFLPAEERDRRLSIFQELLEREGKLKAQIEQLLKCGAGIGATKGHAVADA